MTSQRDDLQNGAALAHAFKKNGAKIIKKDRLVSFLFTDRLQEHVIVRELSLSEF